MTEHSVGREAPQDEYTKKCKSFLVESGFTVIEDSVHGKNQSRFLHFILGKDGEKYFSKANRFNSHETHVNAGLVRKIKNVPAGVTFLTPVKELISGDTIFHIYPYIDRKPISNESENFHDFNVDQEDIDEFLSKVLSAINCVESQTGIVTNNEKNKYSSIKDIVLGLLKKIPNDTPYAVEFLKHMVHEKGLDEYRLAIKDVQAQNMFWNKEDKSLIVFDMDFLGPQLRFFDHAKFISSLWVVYNRPEYAQRFAKMVFSLVSQEEKSLAYQYMKFNLIRESLIDYSVFKDSRERTTEFMEWIRRDLLAIANM